VSLVQVATTLPLFLLSLPAGALADVLDRRRILLIAQVWLFLVTTLLGVLTITGVVQPWMLVVITLAIGAGSAIDLPPGKRSSPKPCRAKSCRRPWDSARSQTGIAGPSLETAGLHSAVETPALRSASRTDRRRHRSRAPRAR